MNIGANYDIFTTYYFSPAHFFLKHALQYLHRVYFSKTRYVQAIQIQQIF